MTETAETTALRALAWTISDEARAERLLALTGLDSDELRARAGEPALLAAVIDFLCAHEPDLIACADALGTTPAGLAATGERLRG
ncbi:DUF3572 domain-containing protein [Sphingomonas naphthae]|uniref:DUF3572 domain-containing protein n=1 Tax=Sphingomonas naphthae TaxID=1813468 RepID=A0ABY7TIC1_9SPHN|nr:DUF3572 domain-containing protein [Sphingomonas naphthae]WCT72977.1 DUF3572 domain-containing protein [Sphingomonas naphthae]